MSFEDEFPSLKSFEIDCRDMIKDIKTQEIGEEIIKRLQIKVTEQVQKHCLDKSKVLAAINEGWTIFSKDESDKVLVAQVIKQYKEWIKEKLDLASQSLSKTKQKEAIRK